MARISSTFNETPKYVDIAMPTYDDEAVLSSAEATVERLQAFGIGEIVVKNGPNSALMSSNGRQEHVPPPEDVITVDNTAAGDSVNAGYMAARLAGENRHPGAIMPQTAAAMH